MDPVTDDAHLDPPTPSDPSSPWRGRLVLLAVTAASSLAIWLVAPEAVTATFSGPGPLLRVGAVVAFFVVASMVIGRLVPNPWLARAIVWIPALAVTWWGVSPYLGDDVVNEEFPVAATATADDEVADPPGTAESDVSPPAAPDPVASDPASSEAAEPPPPATTEPVALAGGSFQGLTGHRGNGTATVYELPDGQRIVRLEDFDVSNGPGLEIHLVPGADQRGPGGGIKLADLRGNVGNQNYEVPADLDLAGDWTVLIWCAPFTVEVANATTSF